MFNLVIQDDEGKTTVVPLRRDEITIGRKEGNTIRLTERNVSRRHARILRNNGEIQIEDLGSYNGIRVNNARIAERVSLRVSDHVQIGDYKLYLKAEGGVEPVDEARTAEHEAATDMMPAATPPPTQPMSIIATPPPGSLAGSASRIAVADTDPQGRPVATAAAITALTTTVGYGKLVVLSSNFAGKEFELSRPQMIIGRTDENDIVVNHRSISRNHAKVVREPETGRYTISDLQSSNGVRVNGQDYGKVELRRGDVIDLGHVRLRFVEPGEDFVFARDAVITDVPDSGGGHRLLIVIVLCLIVLGIVIAFVYMRQNQHEAPKTTVGNASGSDPPGSGSAIDPGGAGSEVVGEGSNGGSATVDPPVGGEEAERIKIACLEAQSRQKWGDLLQCAERLAVLDAKLGAEYKTRAVEEEKSQPRITGVEQALKEKNLKKAKENLDQVWLNSASYQKTKAAYDKAEKLAVDEVVGRLRRARNDCKEFNKILEQERAAKPPAVAQEAGRQVQCAQSPTQPPPQRCDAETVSAKADEQWTSNAKELAFQTIEQALGCLGANEKHYQKAFVLACNLGKLEKARAFWKKMGTGARQQTLTICVRNGITEEKLNSAP